MKLIPKFEPFLERLSDFMRQSLLVRSGDLEAVRLEDQFNALALELFELQYDSNPAYRKFCDGRGRGGSISHWTQIPAVPAAGFKELDLTCLPKDAITSVFHSSGTTGQSRSRHFHSAASLAIYEESLLPWFVQHLLPQAAGHSNVAPRGNLALATLTPAPSQVPDSSLAHMFGAIDRELFGSKGTWHGEIAGDGSWTTNEAEVASFMNNLAAKNHPVMLLGTAFSFVQLCDFIGREQFNLPLPAGSRVMETGGYKSRSRSMPKQHLHKLISSTFEIPETNIVSEYGMSELSSQAYDRIAGDPSERNSARRFHFPPWARTTIISPESGEETPEGMSGLLRIYDLANAFSVMAIQTEDLAVKSDGGFELRGRAQIAEPRGCSLMAT
jgi:hypothetical protein